AGSQGPAGAQGPPGPGSAPTVLSAVAPDFVSYADGNWHDIDGASVTVSLNAAGAVALSWNFAIPVGSVVFSQIAVDGVGLKGTVTFLMQTGSMGGAYNAGLSAGTHKVSLQYMTVNQF